MCSAFLGGRDLESQIIFATIGSIANYAKDLGGCDMLLVDECHNINSANKGQYRKFIAALQRYGNPHLCVIGFTGTSFRGNGVWLHHGDDPLFHGIATNITMTELLESGHLTPLVIDRETLQLGDVQADVDFWQAAAKAATKNVIDASKLQAEIERLKYGKPEDVYYALKSAFEGQYYEMGCVIEDFESDAVSGDIEEVLCAVITVAEQPNVFMARIPANNKADAYTKAFETREEAQAAIDLAKEQAND